MPIDLAPGSWTPLDFVIHGRFCPIEEIEPAIERARLASNASAALLLVADERVVLRTLCGCVPHSDPHIVGLRRLLNDASLLPGREKRRRTTGLQDYVRSTPGSSRERERFPITAPKVLKELVAIARHEGEDALAEWLSQSASRWIPARLPDSVRGARMNAALLFYEPSCDIADEAGSPVIEADAAVIDIMVRITSTAHANVRRDDVIMKRLDDKLDPAKYVAGSVDFEAAADALVDLAVEISDSCAGACYIVDHSKKRFELRAVSVSASAEGDWAYPPDLATHDDALAVAATLEHLTLQLPPGLAHSPLRPTGLTDGESSILELATPLPGPLATPKAPAVGVLTVMKPQRNANAYGAYEIAVMRNVALRLALIATTTNTTQAAQMFARLSMQGARVMPFVGDGNAVTRSPVKLPDDVAVTVPSIEDVLSTLGSVTHSGTVTFRAALPDGDNDGPQGLTLARVAAYPAQQARSKRHALQPESEGGYNWIAVRTGEISNVPKVDQKSADYSEHRRDTRSELAVPVYVEDRVVGVVNLESPVEHAFDAHVEIAQAAAEHIGLAIANARLALSVRLQERATETLRHAHQITHLPEDLMPILDGIPQKKAQALTDAVKKIQSEVDHLCVMPLVTSTAPEVDDTSFPSLVLQAMAEQNIGEEHLTVDDGLWYPHPAPVAVVIAKALADVLDNAKRYRAEVGDPPRLTIAHGEWGGQPQDVLIVTTTPGEILMPEHAINVYRCPLNLRRPTPRADGEKAPLGAYLAGLQIRRVGGDVYLAYTDGRDARVTVAVPAPVPPGQDRGRHP
jgi:GAF domain-containing protein